MLTLEEPPVISPFDSESWFPEKGCGHWLIDELCSLGLCFLDTEE
jgi:hypothetical protein